MILGIHHVQITVPEGREDDARVFYCGVLGLQEAPKPEALAGRGGFWLQVGPSAGACRHGSGRGPGRDQSASGL